ncbi:MAG: hypothetical protein ABR910_02555 [Acidobacteriaceae bacterium]|jgi:hypothetical protein
MQDVLIVGVPLVAILAGILLNRQGVESLRAEMVAFRAEMRARFDAVHRDMREFYGEQARHDLRIGNLEQAKRG